MPGFIYKGILLQQHKEPALSRQLREFLNADMIGLRMAREPVQDVSTLTPDEIIDFAREAGVVDERDGCLLADKLNHARNEGCRCVVVDAIDDEPYISSQINPMLKNPHLSPVGLSLCQRATGADEAHFAVYKNLSDTESRIARKLGDYPVVRIRGRYPANYQAINQYKQQEGTLLIGAGAVIHLARAVLFAKPQTTAFVTVSGDCISNPTNLEVSLGMTVAQTLERCGMLERPNRVIIGGSMTGVSVIDTENTIVTPTTRAILAFRMDKKKYGFDCIGCGRCVQSCPQGLNPFQIYRSIRGNRQDLMRKLSLGNCISCGVCSYICPAKLDLSEMIHHAAQTHVAIHDAIMKSEQHVADYRRSIYRCYIADYQFGRAVIAHRKNRRRLLHDLVRWEKEALQEHKSIEQGIQNSRNHAAATLRQAEQVADHTLEQARRIMQGTRTAADQALELAKRTRDNIYRSADRALSDAQRTCRSAERIADKDVALSISFQRQISNEAVVSAEKNLETLEKSKESVSSILIQDARTAVAQARLSADAATRQASVHAEQTGQRAKENALASLEQASVICEQTKQSTEKTLEDANRLHQEKHLQAEQLFEIAQQDCVAAKDKAHHIYELATAACDNQVTEETARYADVLEHVRERAFAKQKQVDDTLRKIRLEALAAARYAAWSRASVTGRPLSDADFIAPGHLYPSEHSLRVPSLRIPYDREGCPEPNSPVFKQEVKAAVYQLLQMTPTQLAAAIHAFETSLEESPALAIGNTEKQAVELIKNEDDYTSTAALEPSDKASASPLVSPLPASSAPPNSAQKPLVAVAHAQNQSEEESGS